MTLFKRVHMPPFTGATGWLNSEPLGPAKLHDHVVLVNFWTFTCINWLRSEPWVRAWSRAYRDDGLVVVGVHTPEFSFEHDAERVRRATLEMDIDYPVALDNDYAVWEQFANHYWPALYFVDGEGIIRDHHFGEGRYEQSERVIQRLLGVERPLVRVQGAGVEADADWPHLRSPETYLGHRRGGFVTGNGGASKGRRSYEIPNRLPVNRWALGGEWTMEGEKVVLERAGGRIAFRFSARDAHLVMKAPDGVAIPFAVLVDGKPPGLSHGLDVDERGAGMLRDGRLYQLVRQHDRVRDRTLEVAFQERGAEAYVFTFG